MTRRELRSQGSSWSVTNGDEARRVARVTAELVEHQRRRFAIARQSMAHYRVYGFDNGGHIISGHDVECDDDEAAVAEADILLRHGGSRHGGFGEVWKGIRLVGKIPEVATGLLGMRNLSSPGAD